MTKYGFVDKEGSGAVLGNLQPRPTGVGARCAHLPGIRAVVFDVYGTLIVSGVGDVGSSSTVDRGEVLAAMTGLDPARAGECFNRIIRQHHETARGEGIDFPEVEIRNVWRDFYRQCFPARPEPAAGEIERMAIAYEQKVNPTGIMPGMRETVEVLRVRGFALGIASNAQFFTPPLLEQALGQSLTAAGFTSRCSVWSYQLGVAKPSTRLFLRLLEGFGAGWLPDEILYVGNDMLNDILPASKLGMRTALFAGDGRSLRWRRQEPRCQGIRPDLILTQLSQVTECV